MDAERVVWVINPGSTSTKIAIAAPDRIVAVDKIRHKADDLRPFCKVPDQEEFRYRLIREFFELNRVAEADLAAVVGRGGLVRPVKGGTYRINERLLDDCRNCRYGEHVSNLGAPIAHRIAEQYGVPAFVVDPPSVDELWDKARYSGVPGADRISRFHALNIRCVARQAALELGKPFAECAFVVAHMGGGISVATIKHGRAVDVNNALIGDGPFSPDRAGTTAICSVLDRAFAPGATRETLDRFFAKECGLMGYIGTNDLFEVEDRIAAGDSRAAEMLSVMVYTVVREIGARAAVLGRTPDAIILTGGMARSDIVVPEIREMVSFLAPVVVYPGEMEMEALAAGAFRVLGGEEEALDY